MDDYQIVIERANAFFGCALKHSVELDGFSVGTLKNGQSLVVHTVAGSHTLSFIAHGKVEKSILLVIEPGNYVTKLSAKLNGWQKLEITKDVSTNGASYNDYIERPAREKRKPSVARTIGSIFAIFLVIGVVYSIINGTPSKQVSEKTETEELTDEELAAVQLEDATQKFQDGDYMAAIEICNDITSDYPDTETAIGIDSYLDEQFAQYPHYSAKDLVYEYDANIVNADEVYTDTVMVVTGTISSIGKTNNGKNLAVMLNSGTYFYGVQLNFDTSQTESVAALREGDIVSALGKCSGRSGKLLVVFDADNVMIENCYLLDE